MRSLLFTPADGGKKLDKALTCGADAVIVDLEDSIAHDRKREARASAAAFVRAAAGESKRPFLCVRVNGLADRKSTRLNSSHSGESRMPSSA